MTDEHLPIVKTWNGDEWIQIEDGFRTDEEITTVKTWNGSEWIVLTGPEVPDTGTYTFNDADGLFVYNEEGEILHQFQMSSGHSDSESALIDYDTTFVVGLDYGAYMSRFNMDAQDELYNIYTSNNGYGLAIELDTKNIYVGEREDGVGKYDNTDGSEIWKVDHFDGHADTITADLDGYVLVGDRGGSISKLDPDGNLEWKYSTEESRIRNNIQVDIFGNVYAWGTGSFYKLDSEGKLVYQTDNLQKTDRYHGAIAVDRFGNIIVTEDGFLRKLENDAETELWSESLEDKGTGLVVDYQGFIYAVDNSGRFYKYDREGNMIFVQNDGSGFGGFAYDNILGGNMSNENLLYWMDKNNVRHAFSDYQG